jgi:hypothetical protein
MVSSSLTQLRSEPILTFRFWFLATFWVVAGCAVSSIYYFKPYVNTLSSYAVQLLSWGMGDALAKYLPKRTFTVFGKSFSLNPGPWNAKEHALIVVAYWGSVSDPPPVKRLPKCMAIQDADGWDSVTQLMDWDHCQPWSSTTTGN